jgi:hypothetical protein
MDHEETGAGLGWVGGRCISVFWSVSMKMKGDLKLDHFSLVREKPSPTADLIWYSKTVGREKAHGSRKQIGRNGQTRQSMPA